MASLVIQQVIRRRNKRGSIGSSLLFSAKHSAVYRMGERAKKYCKELKAQLIPGDNASTDSVGLGACAKACENIWKHSLLAAIVGVCVWVGAAMLFYHHQNGWGYAKSFFYACDAGLSVGFGSFAEPNDASLAYTLCHLLVGASIIAGALGIFVSVLLDKQEALAVAAQEEARHTRAQGNGTDSVKAALGAKVAAGGVEL